MKIDENIYLDKLRDLIEIQKVTQRKAAEILEVHEDTITKWCKRHQIKTQRTGPRSGEGHPDWKGGRILIGGYWHIYSPDHPYARHKGRYVAEHRLVMEKKLGRYLLPSEVVHHINGVPTSNEPDNLIVFQTNADHLKNELKGKIPNWTEQGRENTLQAVRRLRSHLTREERLEKAKLNMRRWRKNQKLLKCDDNPLPQSNDHQTS